MMRLVRHAVPIVAFLLTLTSRLESQEPAGTIKGTVIDANTKEPLVNVTVRIEAATPRQTTTGARGEFLFGEVPPGTHRIRALRIGYAHLQQDVTLTAGQDLSVDFAMEAQAALIDPIVVTGYGTTRREAITGAVATIDPTAANVGVLPNVNSMLQGRAAGVTVITNSGDPGAGAQIRIRGGTSISASNEPLYVVDGVPITNAPAEDRGIGIGGSPPLDRSPLNLLNPGDIASITILKDASASALYGSRGANGVVLIETKKGSPAGGGGTTVEYEGYVASGTVARRYDALSGLEYKNFVAEQIANGVLAPGDTVNANGGFDTNWEKALERSSLTQNHNLSFAGGSDVTRYRASINYMDDQGIMIGSSFNRIQGRLSGTHSTWDNRLRLGVNVTTSRVNNDYLSFENSGGFEGGVFVNMVTFNPTQPITVTDAQGEQRYYETGTGSQSLRNPVAIANQIDDVGSTSRTLGNASVAFDVSSSLTATVNVGVDQSDGVRQTYMPAQSAVGAAWNGRARQVNRENSSVTLQTQLNFSRQFSQQTLDVVGAYEYTENKQQEFGVEAQDFTTDVTSFNNLAAAGKLVAPWSYLNEEKWISFIGRANYGLKDKYFITGVVRYDGRSAFAEGHKWAAFPALSGSWRISSEDFWHAPLGLNELRLRVGYGIVGNPGVQPYASQQTFESTAGARYGWGDTKVVGFVPTRNPNPNLKFERTSQINLAVDYGLMDNRLSGSIEYYVKNTDDLLLEVDVPVPAAAGRQIQNIGSVRNSGVELSLDALLKSKPGLIWRAGLVMSSEHGEVKDIGGVPYINTGIASGEGQSGTPSQRVLPGQPLGTFWGQEYAGVDAQGRQLVRCTPTGPSDTQCVDGVILAVDRRASDERVIGNANPDLLLGLTSQITIGKFDASLLIRGAFGAQLFNNTGLVYGSKTKVRQGRNFLKSALDDEVAIGEPAIYSSKWVQDADFVRLQNVTVGYTFAIPKGFGSARDARIYVSGDNLLLFTPYDGVDPEVHTENGIASRGLDYMTYPRPRLLTFGARLAF